MFMNETILTHKGFTVEVLPIGISKSSVGDECSAGLVLQWHVSEQPPKTILLSDQAKSASLTTTLLPTCTLDLLFNNGSYTCCNKNKSSPSEQTTHTSSPTTFNRDASNLVSSKTACAEASFFIVTDIGELMLARLVQGEANLLSLCQTEMGVTWIGVLEDRGPVICVVHSTGSAMILDPAAASRPTPHPHEGPSPPSFLWSFFDLDHYIVCCCSVGSSLVTSDGHTVTISDVKLKRRGREAGSKPMIGSIDRVGASEGGSCDNHKCDCCIEIDLIVSSVDIFGVVDIAFNNDLILKTVDGRIYQYTWEQFKKKAKRRSKTSTKEKRMGEPCDDDTADPSIAEVMRGIERCTNLHSDVQRKSKEVDCYLEQLSLAQHLHQLDKTKNVNIEVCHEQFKLNYYVNPSTHHEHVFDLVVSLTCSIVGLDFNGKWWRMRVSVPSETGFKHVSVKLKESLPDNVVVIGMTQAEANRLLLQGEVGFQSSLVLKCDIILNDFSNLEPIISTEVVREKLCIFRFLTNQRRATHELNPTLTFEQVLYSMQNMACADGETVLEEVQRITLVFPHSERFVSRLNDLTNFSNLEYEHSSKNNNTKKHSIISGEKRLWFLDNIVNIKATSSNADTITLVISSLYVPLAIAVKREVEECFTEACDSRRASNCTDDVTISHKTIRDIHVTQRLLDASLDDASSPSQAGVLKNLYEHVSLLISSLP